jgi:hypothetical protein
VILELENYLHHYPSKMVHVQVKLAATIIHLNAAASNATTTAVVAPIAPIADHIVQDANRKKLVYEKMINLLKILIF